MQSNKSFTKPTGTRRWSIPVVSAFVIGLATVAQAQAEFDNGVHVQTRGQIHEAFAEASMTGSMPGPIVARAPRFPIAEMPPDQRPRGNNVSWISGYWGWDDDRDDFIWVSGVWRDLPPGRQWVPGYWGSASGGVRWISGFWGDVAQRQVTYLPPPPEPYELGPNSPNPGPGNIWTPGSWVWQQQRYDWQPGYWVPQQQDWVWSPAHYTWTPRGYVYVPGYWDHDIGHRGVMFAPVYYEQPVYMRSNYSYSPSIVIDLGAILASLFVQPRSNHYYYGDYYDRRYEDHGIYPWHSQQITQYGDDPIYVNYRTSQLQRDPQWDGHINKLFQHRREHVEARPPQTLALQVNFIKNQTTPVAADLVIGKTLAETVTNEAQPIRFTPVPIDERKQIQKRERRVHKQQTERAKMESQPKGVETAVAVDTEPVSVPMPLSPVAAKPIDALEGEQAPPAVPVAPQPRAAKGKARRDKPQALDAKATTEIPVAAPETVEVSTEKDVVEPVPAPAEPSVEMETPQSQPAAVEEATVPDVLQTKPVKVNAKDRTRPEKDARAPQSADKKRQVKSKAETTSEKSNVTKADAPRVTSKSKSATPKTAEPTAEPKDQAIEADTTTALPETKEAKATKVKGEKRSPKSDAKVRPDKQERQISREVTKEKTPEEG